MLGRIFGHGLCLVGWGCEKEREKERKEKKKKKEKRRKERKERKERRKKMGILDNSITSKTATDKTLGIFNFKSAVNTQNLTKKKKKNIRKSSPSFFSLLFPFPSPLFYLNSNLHQHILHGKITSDTHNWALEGRG